MQASLPDGPGLPGAAVRAGGGDESTVSRLGRFKAGGVMVVPAKTTGASRTYHWKITFPSQETRGPRPPPPPPSFSPPRLLSFSGLVLPFLLRPASSFIFPLLSALLSVFSWFFLLLSLLLRVFSRPRPDSLLLPLPVAALHQRHHRPPYDDVAVVAPATRCCCERAVAA